MNSVVTEDKDKELEEEKIRSALSRCGYPKWTFTQVKEQMATNKQVKRKNHKKDTTKKSKGYVLEHRPSWPKQQKQQLTLDLSSVHQRQSIWLWIATFSQPFKSMEIQSTMYQILDTLVPWWHLAQVTSKGESHLLGVHSRSWNNFGRVHTHPLQQKLSCLILLVSLYYSMAVNCGWSPRIWKTKSTPLLPHATESCWI